MTNILSDAYWSGEFAITRNDLDRTAAHIHETACAHDLTALAKRVVRGRLLYGPDAGARAVPPWASDPSVRLWDPAGQWQIGDHAIVLTWSSALKRSAVMLGEIVAMDSSGANVAVDDKWSAERRFLFAAIGSGSANEWQETVRKAVETLRKGVSPEEQVEAVLLQHGHQVGGQLLDALQPDPRFVSLGRRWYLRELAAPLTEQQISALGWAMLQLDDAQPTETLVKLVEPPLAEGDRGLFGLYLAMRDRADLFSNADPGQRPRWVLAGPPPGPFVPRCAAYDPQTYEVLCLPDERASPEVAKHLWDLGLLQAVA
jgi:hypothetical protein